MLFVDSPNLEMWLLFPHDSSKKSTPDMAINDQRGSVNKPFRRLLQVSCFLLLGHIVYLYNAKEINKHIKQAVNV